MKIHLLSDLHLETGAYALPADLDCDVIVAAGDIGAGQQGIAWLKTLDKPVIYVLGNHEYWSTKDDPVDWADVIKQTRAAASGSNVHFLENDSVVIDGVRFLGATLWTDFGRFNPSLITEAAAFMNDYAHICCPSFYANEKNMKKFYALADDFLLLQGRRDDGFKEHLTRRYVEKSLLHPFVTYLRHQQTMKWLNSQFTSEELTYFDGKTVVVTHHHPSYESLRRIGIKEFWLTPGQKFRAGGRSPNDDLHKVAAYASDVSVYNWIHQAKGPDTPIVTAWLCGHLHHHLDYMHEGMRVASNARGYYSGPLTLEQAEAFALFGMPVGADEIERSQQTFKADPYRGDGYQFDATFIVDLAVGLQPVIAAEVAVLMPTLDALHAEIGEFAPHFVSPDPILIKGMRELIRSRADKFRELTDTFQTSLELNLGLKYARGERVNRTFNNLHFTDWNIAQETNVDRQAKIDALLSAQKDWMQFFAAFPENMPVVECKYIRSDV